MKKLQVGESYENRLGTSYLIECRESEGEFPFRGVYIDHNGEADYDLFTEQGCVTSFGYSCYDLVIPDEPEQTIKLSNELTKEEPEMKTLRVGETYKDKFGFTFLVESLDLNVYTEPLFKALHEDGVSFDICTKDGIFIGNPTDPHFNLVIPDEPEVQLPVQTEVKPEVQHLDVILAIVQKIPVQFKNMHTDGWIDLDERHANPISDASWDWRIKPQPEPKRTVQIGKRIVVAPEIDVPMTGVRYFYRYGDQCLIYKDNWKDSMHDTFRLSNNNVFLTEQDAINCQEAIKALLLGLG